MANIFADIGRSNIRAVSKNLMDKALDIQESRADAADRQLSRAINIEDFKNRRRAADQAARQNEYQLEKLEREKQRNDRIIPLETVLSRLPGAGEQTMATASEFLAGTGVLRETPVGPAIRYGDLGDVLDILKTNNDIGQSFLDAHTIDLKTKRAELVKRRTELAEKDPTHKNIAVLDKMIADLHEAITGNLTMREQLRVKGEHARRLQALKDEGKPEKPEVSPSSAVDKVTAAVQAIHRLETGQELTDQIMERFRDDPEMAGHFSNLDGSQKSTDMAIEALRKKIDYYSQFLPEGYDGKTVAQPGVMEGVTFTKEGDWGDTGADSMEGFEFTGRYTKDGKKIYKDTATGKLGVFE